LDSGVKIELFAREGCEVLTVDADPDANLASAFGVPAEKRPQPLIQMKQLIQERTGTDSIGAYFKPNPKVSDLPEKYCLETNGLKLLVLGGPTSAGAGCACPEAAFLRALLTHTILQRREVIIVDLAAGVEFMGRASVQGIDVMVVVVEPGARSIETALKIAKMARQMGIKHTAVVANKISDPVQIEAISSRLEDLTLLGNIDYVEALQQADLKGEPVFQTSVELVAQLTQAKKVLTDFFTSSVSCESR
jgi:CO dehydrogenase maturation factor